VQVIGKPRYHQLAKLHDGRLGKSRNGFRPNTQVQSPLQLESAACHAQSRFRKPSHFLGTDPRRFPEVDIPGTWMLPFADE
jgi:hypothetical protein